MEHIIIWYKVISYVIINNRAVIEHAVMDMNKVYFVFLTLHFNLGLNWLAKTRFFHS